MSEKYSEADEDKQQEINAIVEKAESMLREGCSSRPDHALFGICHSCAHFCVVESEFDILYAGCSSYDLTSERGLLPLSQRKPVIRCSLFSERGTMSLFEMKSMATLIDPPARKVGFINDD